MPSYRDYENRNRVSMSSKKRREYRRRWGASFFTKKDLRAVIRLARRDKDKAVVRAAQAELRKRERKARYRRRGKSQYIYVMGKWVKV